MGESLLDHRRVRSVASSPVHLVASAKLRRCAGSCELLAISVTMGQKLHSKRQRKQRANASLKRKQFDRPDDQVDDTLPAPQRYCVI